jgi:hypothetical protein
MTAAEKKQVREILTDGVEVPVFSETRKACRNLAYQAWMKSKKSKSAQSALESLIAKIDELTIDSISSVSRQ